MCQLSAERIRLDVVGADNLAAELDDRDALAVAGLELVVSGDVDLPQLEAELVLKLTQLRAREVAQVAALRAVKDDLYG